MDLATMRELPTESAATLQPSDEHSDTLLALASAVLLQLDTDATCPVFVKNIFQDVEDVLWYLREAQVSSLASCLFILIYFYLLILNSRSLFSLTFWSF